MGVLALAWLTGCGALHQRGSARGAMRDGDYDQAVAELRQAIEINPNDQETQILLGEAETAAAERRLANAQRLLADHRPREARRELHTALGYIPTHPVAISEMATADAAIARSDELLREARAALENRNWQRAIDHAQAALTIDRSLDEAQAIVTAAAEQNPEPAWTVARAPVMPLPGAVDVSTPLAEAPQPPAPPPPPPAAKAPAPVAAPPPVVAQAPASDLQPAPAVAAPQPVLSPADRAIAAARAEVAARRWSRAVEILDQAVAEQPQAAALATERSAVACRWAEELLRDADEHAQREAWDAAWPLALQASVLCPTVAKQADKLLDKSEEGVIDRAAYGLGIIPLAQDEETFALSMKAARQLERALDGLNVHGVSLSGSPGKAEVVPQAWMDLSDRKAIERLARWVPRANRMVTVTVSSTAQDVRRPGEPGSSRYQAGTQTARNPQYPAAEQAFNQARQRLSAAKMEAERNAASYDAAGQADLRSDRRFIARAATGYYGDAARLAVEEYHAALQQLQNAPTQIEQEAWREHHYPVQVVERRLTLRLGLRLVEVPSGQVTYREDDVAVQVTHSDTSHEADAEHGVSTKQAVLRPVAELQAEALEKLTAQLAEPARRLLARRALEHQEEARRLPGDQAGPAYVRFLFAGREIIPAQQLQAGAEQLWRAATAQSLREPCMKLTLQRLQAAQKKEDADRAADAPLVATVSMDNPAQPRIFSAPDGISIGLRGTRPPASADIDVRSGERQARYNGLRARDMLTVHGASGTRYRFMIEAVDAAAGSMQFSLRPLR